MCEITEYQVSFESVYIEIN